MAPRVSLTLLGGFEARLVGGPAIVLPRKSRALLAYLALARRPTSPREELATLLWGDTGDTQARQSLRKALSGLSQVLNRDKPAALVVSLGSVALDPAVVQIDVRRFDDLAQRGAPDALARAVTLYRGDLLAGLIVNEAPFDEWLMAERARRQQAAVDALVRLLAHQSRSGPRAAAVETATRLLGLDPLREPAHRALMRLHVAGGLRAAALRQYQACVDVLQRELGVAPEAETRRLYEDILREQSRDASAPAPRASLRRDVATDEPSGIPFVGRDAEVARLSEALDEAIAGQARVAVVLGEAGIGKTRLVARVCAAASARGVRVVAGRAHPTEQILPFGPWMDAFRSGGIVRDPVLRHRRSAASRAELARLLPELGAPPSGNDPLRLFEAVTTVLAALAGRQPLLVVIEDLHWADDLSLRLLAFLSRRLCDKPIMFLISVREESLGDAAGLRMLLRDLEGERTLITVSLGPLSEVETSSLVRTLGRAAAREALDRLAGRIWDVSEGNPLMAVETLRAVEQGLPSTTTGHLPIAERVREVVLARLERVSEPGRRLLDTAAAIGRDFAFPLLQRASGLDDADAASGVEELVRRRILRMAGDLFQFAHERFREVVYLDVLPPRRRILHRRVAEALEALHAADLAPVANALAFHYREAEVWDRTVHWSRAAGGRAFMLGGQREAAAAFTQALDALAHLPEDDDALALGIDLRLDLRHALQPLSEVESVVRVMKEALGLAERLGDRRRLGHVLAFLSTHHWWDGEHAEALDCARRSLAIADELDDPRMRVSAMYCEAQTLQACGDYTRTAELLRRCLGATAGGLTSQRFGSTDFSRVFATSRLAATLAELGDFPEADEAADEAVRISERLRHPYLLSFAYRAAAWVCLRRGRFDQAVDWMERLLRDVQSRGQSEVLFRVAPWMLAYAYALAQRPEAAAMLGRGISPAPSGLRIFTYPLWLACLAEAYLLTGRPVDAHDLATTAVEVGRACGERGHTAWALRLLGGVAAGKGDLADAEHRYREALAMARALGMRPLQANCLRELGEVQRRASRPADARGSLAEAHALYRDVGMTAWLPR